MEHQYLDIKEINAIIDHAFEEDIKTGDITTDSIIPKDTLAVASMSAKADGIIAGLDIAKMVFLKLDKNIKWNANFVNGDKVKIGDVIVNIEGTYRALLTGERLALNILQRMSGIASETSKYVEQVKNTNVKILDTRKTVPGLRILDKYAVSIGGGTNHRIGLYDMAMIKDNHIKTAGSIAKAVRMVRDNIDSSIKIEVETTNIDEVEQALEAQADIIMLDNMTNKMMSEAVILIDNRAKVEASGNMSLDRIKGVAQTGVDLISIGALTHSVEALDISQNIKTL